jgi:hypothetical protein
LNNLNRRSREERKEKREKLASYRKKRNSTKIMLKSIKFKLNEILCLF